MQFPLTRVRLAARTLGLVLLIGTTGSFVLRPSADGVVSEAAAAGPSGTIVASPVDRVEATPAELSETSMALEEARARWFELVYAGRNFDAQEGWMASQARHPEP